MGKKKFPKFFVIWSVVNLMLAIASSVLMIVGKYNDSYAINPVYIIMMGIGFAGLSITGIVAMLEWNKNSTKKTN